LIDERSSVYINFGFNYGKLFLNIYLDTLFLEPESWLHQNRVPRSWVSKGHSSSSRGLLKLPGEGSTLVC